MLGHTVAPVDFARSGRYHTRTIIERSVDAELPHGSIDVAPVRAEASRTSGADYRPYAAFMIAVVALAVVAVRSRLARKSRRL